MAKKSRKGGKTSGRRSSLTVSGGRYQIVVVGGTSAQSWYMLDTDTGELFRNAFPSRWESFIRKV
jgi:hypothetical protein